MTNPNNANAEVPESNETNRRLHRLSIKHLMIWVFGVAVAITAAQHLARSSHDANSVVLEKVGWPPTEFEPMGLSGTVVAAGFGTGISLAVLAMMSGPGFWRDPARIGIVVLGAIGLLNFFVQLLVTKYVAHTAGSSYIWGAPWFAFCEFTVHLLGFILVCVLTLWVKVRWNWRFAWWSLVLFALFGLIIHSFGFPAPGRYLPALNNLLTSHWQWAKLIQTGISVTGLTVAISIDLWQRNRISWLVIVTAIGMIIGQVAMHVAEFSRL